MDFDFSKEHEFGPFNMVCATVYYMSSASGWDAVTAKTMTGGGCGYTSAQGQIMLKQLVPTTVSGTATAFGEGGVSLELTYEACYTKTLAAEGSYRFEELLPGQYTLVVSQEGSLTRSYDLTVSEGENTLDVKIHQPGDVTGDGKINIGDVARSYAHVRDSVSMTGYRLRCADFTGDGKVTMGDIAKAYSVIHSHQAA